MRFTGYDSDVQDVFAAALPFLQPLKHAFAMCAGENKHQVSSTIYFDEY